MTIELSECVIDAIANAVVKKMQELRWIPISKRLPRDGSWNIFTDGTTISVERYKKDAIDHFYPNGRWFSLDEVVAWMPLPESYEPQESDHKCHTCKHYTSGEHDGSCGSYICKAYSNWESEE